MLKESLYHKTVDILYQAYFNDKLEHGHPCACAIGNLVAANTGIAPVTVNDVSLFNTGTAFDGSQWYWLLKPENVGIKKIIINNEVGEQQIKSTGYSMKEILEIERAFEGADGGDTDEDFKFNGLVAVLETLKEIHQVENNDTELCRFKKHYVTKAAL